MTWYDSDWSYRKQITINSECISGNQTNFPILYKISGIGDDSLPNGTDIIFVSSNDITRYSHDLISFHNYTGNAWVRIPNLSDGSTYGDKTLYMYYGNLTGGDQTAVSGYKPSSTWDDNYLFVCHMKDAATNKDLTDSTKWQVPLKKRVAGEPVMVKSFLGSGQKFVNAVDSDKVISSQVLSTYATFNDAASIEAIISGQPYSTNYGYIFNFHNLPTDTNYHTIVLMVGAKPVGAGNLSTAFGISTNIYRTTAIGAVHGYWPSTNIVKTALIGGNYSHIAQKSAIYAGGKNLYEPPSDSGDFKQQNQGIYIGNRPAGLRQFSGSILELRVSTDYKNTGWFKTGYLNVSSMSANKNTIFYTIGITENAPAGGVTSTSFNTKSGSATFWQWKPVTLNTGSAPRSRTANSLEWSWGIVTGDGSTYIPSGNAIWWGWCLEDK